MQNLKNNPASRIKFIKWLFFLLFFADLALIISTPRIINRGALFIQREDDFEALLMVLLFFVGYVLYYFYKKELDKSLNELKEFKLKHETLEERLDESLRHIGSINVQIQEIRSVFSDLEKYPESKKDFKFVLNYLTKKVLSIVNVDWVLVRIVNPEEFKTLAEYNQCRGTAILLKHNIANEELISGKSDKGDFSFVGSGQGNLNLRVFLIFPRVKINKEQEILLRVIINQLELTYIIFTSNYYKNSRSNANEGQNGT